MTESEDEIRLKELLSVFGKDRQKEIIEILHRDQIRYHKEQLNLHVVVASLPTKEEINSRLKHVVENSFEVNEVVEKREYSLGFRACYNWLKIKQMKIKG